MPSTPRPSIFDMTGRAKWNAWAAAGKQYQDAQEAEKRYLEIAQTLGWAGSTAKIQVENVPSSSTGDSDTLEASNSGGGGGMGLSVSVLMPSSPSSAIDKSIHGLALSNDVSGLTILLEQCPETDLNAVDEYVSQYYYFLQPFLFLLWNMMLKSMKCRVIPRCILLVIEEISTWSDFY